MHTMLPAHSEAEDVSYAEPAVSSDNDPAQARPSGQAVLRREARGNERGLCMRCCGLGDAHYLTCPLLLWPERRPSDRMA
jgi:hypothetical protein